MRLFYFETQNYANAAEKATVFKIFFVYRELRQSRNILDARTDGLLKVELYYFFVLSLQIDMSCILHIETSTDVCSVALSENGACIFKQENSEGRNHARLVAPYADEAISFADSHAIPLDAVAVSTGPGSYTGLRIGVSVAKGICYARDLKLIALPTLKVMCVPILLRDELPDDALLCPMIAARRMEVYSCIYDRALKEVRPISADVITADSFQEELTDRPLYFFGDGAEKCRSVISHANAHFIDGIVPKAKYMFPLAEQAYARGQFEDVAYFEPYYLKQFVPVQSKKVFNVLHKHK